MAYISTTAKPRSRVKRLIELLLKASVTLGLLAIVLSKTDLSAVLSAVWEIGFGTFGVAVAIIVLLSVLVANRWREIVWWFGHEMSLYDSWRIVTIGLFFNQCLPSGVGGDVVRVISVMRLGMVRGPAFVSVVVDRLFALAAVGVCMLVGLWFLPPGNAFFVNAVLTALVMGGMAVFLMVDRTLSLMEGIVSVTRSGWWGRLRPVTDLGRMVSQTVVKILRRRRPAQVIILTSLLNQLALGGIIFLIGNRLDPGLRFIDALVLFPPAMLLSMLPISLGGWGIREGAMVFFLGIARVGPTTAVVISLTFGAAMTVAGALGGIMWLLPPRGSTHPMAAVASPER